MAIDLAAVAYRTIAVGDTEVFYREAGAPRCARPPPAARLPDLVAHVP